MSRDVTDMKIAVVPGGVAILIGGVLEGIRGPSGPVGGVDGVSGKGDGAPNETGGLRGALAEASVTGGVLGGVELFPAAAAAAAATATASASARRPGSSHAILADLERSMRASSASASARRPR
jgi:hypothetical protein